MLGDRDPAPRSTPARTRTLFPIFLLLIPALVAYWPASSSEFIFDDKQYIGENPHVRTGLSWGNVRWALTATYASNWHPLTWVSHMLDVEVWGMAARGHRVTSLLIHLGNVALLFLVLRLLTGAVARSWVVAALFGLHPVHVESVSWVAERKDVLSVFFGLLAVCAYAGYVRRPGKAKYLLLVALIACSLMSKPMLVTFPFVLLLLDYWPLSRFGPVAGMARSPGARIASLVLEKVPLLLLSAASSLVTYAAQQKAMVPLESLPFPVRLSNALISYVWYVFKMVLPFDLAAFYPYPGFSPGGLASLGAGLLVLSLVGIATVLARRFPHMAIGWLWYLGTLVPVIGLVQVGGQSVADRYTYVPSIGIFLALVWTVSASAVTKGAARRALTLAAAAVILVLAAMTKVQSGYWRDAVALFEHAIEATSDNWVAHYQLGLALTDRGRLDEAEGHYREFVRISPANAGAEHNIGTLLLQRGKLREAVPHFQKALRLKPDYAEAHSNLGIALLGLGRLREAHGHFTTVLAMDPRSPSAHGNLGAALALMGRNDEAIFHVREALRLDPTDAKATRMLGKLTAGERLAPTGEPR